MGGWGGSLKCERSYIRLISHPSLFNLLIKQVLQEVKRCVSRPHEDRWHPSARFEGDKRERARGLKEKEGYLNWSTQKQQQQGDTGDWGLFKKAQTGRRFCFVSFLSKKSGDAVNKSLRDEAGF